MRRVATLRNKHYEERLSARNDSRESIINSEYLFELEAKFEKPSDTE
jgi:hypothetical protein